MATCVFLGHGRGGLKRWFAAVLIPIPPDGVIDAIDDDGQIVSRSSNQVIGQPSGRYLTVSSRNI